MNKVVALLGSSILVASASVALAAQPCREDGQCTVFQVAVKLPYKANSKTVDANETIYIGGQPNYYQSTVTMQGDSCSKEVRVPSPVYNTIMEIMESMSSNDAPPPVLTPAQQTILLFYSTLMQQTMGFTCSQQ